jgi:ribose 5-phosphate isomerase B
MKIAFACDHAGFVLRGVATEAIISNGHALIDYGTFSTEPVDWPDCAEKVGRAIQRGDADRGILVCGSGVGAAIAANKLHGIRAGLCHDIYSAHQAVEYDNINVLTLGALVVGPAVATELIRSFLGARFLGIERHVRRLKKLSDLEMAG